MPKTFTENSFPSTYKDDYKDSDNYYRILFNSGRALQARELTQLQTIIQSEIGRFGRNIFKEGASVNPGGATIDTSYEFVKLSSVDEGVTVGTVFTGASSNIQARVLQHEAATATDPETFYIQYTSTKNSTASSTSPKRFQAGETLSNGSITATVQTTNTVSNPAVGQGTRFSCAAGDFFVRGHFVFAANQSILLSKYTKTPSAVVGFVVSEDIVTVDDFDALYDNQGANPNFSSPGADRYRIRLTLTTQDLVDSDQNFVYYCDVREGRIVDQVTGTEDYNKINDLLAQRTKEESGNYIVSPFRITFQDDSANGDDTVLFGKISSGIAYVNGYRAEAPAGTTITMAKPRTTIEFPNQTNGIGYGQYFLCDTFKGAFPTDDFDTINLSTHASDPSGSVIGTARTRYVEATAAGTYKVYLFDIQMNSGQSVRDIKTIGLSSTIVATPILEASKAVLKESSQRNMLFRLPRNRPAQFSDVNLEVQRLFANRTATGTTVSIATGDALDTFTSSTEWIIIKDSDGSVVTTATIGAMGSTTASITNLPTSGANYSIYAKVNKASGAGAVPSQTRIKTKLLTSIDSSYTLSSALLTDGDIQYIDLSVADIFEVDTIAQDSAGGLDLSSNFKVDDGQRAGFYDKGRLILRENVSAPTGTLYVAFKHFQHNADGDFFCAQSYDGQIPYNRIPSFLTAPRQKISLRDVLDFRSTIGADGTFTGTGGRVIEMPANGDVFQADITYYQPRNDRIVLNENGIISVITGEDGLTPQLPPQPENVLTLFEVYHNAYGLNDSDISNRVIKAKRFTMSDIARLEERIDKVEEMTTLSLLEANTANLLVLDSSGNPRTKAGFLVDNFSDRGFTDVFSPEARSSVDPSQRIMRPGFNSSAFTLRWDSDASSGVVLKGDNIYLDYTHVSAMEQTVMSGTENINPFAVITNQGHLTISPRSDSWIETAYVPENVINETAEEVSQVNLGDTQTTVTNTVTNRTAGQFAWTEPAAVAQNVDVFFGLNNIDVFGGGWFGNWEWNWMGTPAINPTVAPQQRQQQQFTSTTTTTSSSETRSFSERIVTGSRTVREEIGDRTVSFTFLPWMRSRIIYFRAEGLRPNAQYFPFFDGRNVSQWCRGGTDAVSETFKRIQDNRDNEFGRANSAAANHPRGSSNLISDNQGKIEGSFFLPARSDFRFKSGSRTFKLLDISVNDDRNALSRASTNYVSQGALDTRQKTIRSTRITEVQVNNWTETTTTITNTINQEPIPIEPIVWRDPLAQSILVTDATGIYVTKVDIFFKTKDDIVPVQLQIRPIVNGIPSSYEIVPGATKFLTPSQVTAFDDVLTANPGFAEDVDTVVQYPTSFEFDEPVYLMPNTEYAVVLIAETVNYNVYVAETYAFQLGTTEKRVARQPSMGSLFKSQNGTTWEPDQTKDLAYRVWRAKFSPKSGYATFVNRELPKEIGSFATFSGDSDVAVFLPNHGFAYGETVVVSGFDSATTYNGHLGSKLNGSQTITAYDGLGFKFKVANSTGTSTGRIVITPPAPGDATQTAQGLVQKQEQFDILIPNVDLLTPQTTNVSIQTKLTTGRSISALISEQTKYQKDTSFRTNIQNKQENYFERPYLVATTENETANLGAGNKSFEMRINLSTENSTVSPLIDTQRMHCITVANMIDNPDSDGTSGREYPLTIGGFNKPITYVAETSPSSGTALAKHVTVPVTLEEDAVGIKVLLAAQRPIGAEIDVYWRTAVDEEIIFDKSWTQVSSETEIAPDANNFREYRYLVGGDGGALSPFSQYQVKIVMRSNNSSAVPVFKDLRVIAMAT